MRLPARPLLASCGLLMLTLAGCSGGDQPAEQPGGSPSGTASATSTPSASPSASASASAPASPTGEPTGDSEESESPEDSSEAPGEDMDEAPDAPESDPEEPGEDSAGGYDAAEVANGSYGPGAEADENGYVGPSDAYYGYEGYVEPGFEYQVGSECFDAALGRCKTSGEIQAEGLGEGADTPPQPAATETGPPVDWESMGFGCFEDENGGTYCADPPPPEDLDG